MSEMSSFLKQKMEAVEVQEEITGMDIPLIHCRLNPDETKFHPLTHEVDAVVIEQAIDAIYTAANAGNAYASFLIHAAAQNQYTDKTSQNTAFTEPMQISDENLRWYSDDISWREKSEGPIESTLESLAELDGLIASIEVTLEDARNHRLTPNIT